MIVVYHHHQPMLLIIGHIYIFGCSHLAPTSHPAQMTSYTTFAVVYNILYSPSGCSGRVQPRGDPGPRVADAAAAPAAAAAVPAAAAAAGAAGPRRAPRRRQTSTRHCKSMTHY